jgi:hypothetical protein
MSMRATAGWLLGIAVIAGISYPRSANAQLRVEPSAGVVFGNHMLTGIVRDENGDVRGSFQSVRNAAPALGLALEYPADARVALVASYTTAGSEYSITGDPAPLAGEMVERDVRLNLFSAQGRLRITPGSSRLLGALSAGPARIGYGTGYLDVDGFWGGVAAVRARYQIGARLSVGVVQEVFVYERGDEREADATLRFGLSMVPWK